MRRFLNTMTFWRFTAGVILLLGAYATFVRFTQGLGAATHLSDNFPWGIWIGFDILCGVGLAAGGFTLVAIVHIFHLERFKPILRPTILTAFLGYLLVIFALLFDLGRPLSIWHALVMWNPRSVMFEVAWCVMLYTTVLSLEFAPVALEKLGWQRPLKLIKLISLPLIIIGVLLSTLHQSSLGSLYLIVPEKLYPLWYTPYLPVFFFFSAMAVGCAMIIFESFLSARAFKKGLELPLLSELARVSVVLLGVLLMMKFMDLKDRGALAYLFQARTETYLYWAELGVGLILPLILLSLPAVRRNRNGLFLGATMIILGFILNRMNISLTGMEASAGVSYFPSWMEIAVTVSIVTAGFIAFSLAAKHLPLFESPDEAEPAAPAYDIGHDLRNVSRAGAKENQYALLEK
jgi:Ni/Fe-hydrogenase subunit HybB-like protein